MPYDEFIIQMVWELDDNLGFADLLRVDAVEDFVGFLEAASLLEAEYGHHKPNKRLVYRSMLCLLDCMQILRLASLGLLPRDTHSFCPADTAGLCACPALHRLTRNVPAYIERLKLELFCKDRGSIGGNLWLLVFYSLCLQSYVRRALISLEQRWLPPVAGVWADAKPHVASTEYLHDAVILFKHICIEGKGKLAKLILEKRARPSQYVGREASSWEKWHEEGLETYLDRIFEIPNGAIIQPMGPVPTLGMFKTLQMDTPSLGGPSTPAISPPSPWDAGAHVRQLERDRDVMSDVTTFTTSYSDSVFSHQGTAMTMATSISRRSWDGSVCSVDLEDYMSFELGSFDSSANVLHFATLDALLGHLRHFITATNDTPVNISCKWGLPEFVDSEQSTESLDLGSEAILVMSQGRGLLQNQRRFSALTWEKLVDKLLGRHPAVSAFLAGVTERTANQLDEIKQKVIRKSWPFAVSP